MRSLNSIYLLLGSTVAGDEQSPVAAAVDIDAWSIRAIDLASCRHRQMLLLLPLLAMLMTRLAVPSPKSIYLLLGSTVSVMETLPVAVLIATVECDIRATEFASCRQRNILPWPPLLMILRIRLAVSSLTSIYLLLVSTVTGADRLPVAAVGDAVDCEMRSIALASCRHRKMLY